MTDEREIVLPRVLYVVWSSTPDAYGDPEICLSSSWLTEEDADIELAARCVASADSIDSWFVSPVPLGVSASDSEAHHDAMISAQEAV